MPKFDFYPSFNAGEVSPLIDARTSLEKYRSACRTLENFQILPYGGVMRRPGTQYLGTAKSGTTQTRLIGFNFSTTTRFVIEMGVGYLRFWSGATGALVNTATPANWATGVIYTKGKYARESGTNYYCLVDHTAGTFANDLSAGRWVAQSILEVPTPYAASDLREVQFAQVNDIMYFAHANHPPYKLSRLADNNWNFEIVDWDYPPLQDQNATDGVVNVTQGSTAIPRWTAGTTYTVGDYVQPPAWTANTAYVTGDIVENGSVAYKATANHTSPASFTTTNWAAQAASGLFRYKALTTHTAGTSFGVDADGTKFSSLPLPLNRMGRHIISAPANTFTSAMVGQKMELKWPTSFTGFGSSGVSVIGTSADISADITQDNVSQPMEIEGEWDLITNGKWKATIQVLRIDRSKTGLVVATATRSGSTVSVYHPNHGWSDGDAICVGGDPGITGTPYYTREANISVTGTHTYTYTTPDTTNTGTIAIAPINLTKAEVVAEFTRDTNNGGDSNILYSGNQTTQATFLLRVINWLASTNTPGVPVARIQPRKSVSGGFATILQVFGSSQALIRVDSYLGSNRHHLQANTKLWSLPAFYSGNYPRTVAIHEQRVFWAGTSREPVTLWGSEIDNFENFKIGANASDSVKFTLAASEGNRINWMYSQQNSLLIGTSGDEWTVSAADVASALSATNLEAKRQSAYGSKYMRGAIVNDVLLFVQRNGRKLRELVYELNKDGWVAPDLTLLAEHITRGEIVEIAYQQQPDAVLWCVRGDGTLVAMTYERDQKVVGWHRHLIGDTADVESVATIYGNGTEDELWMAVKHFSGIAPGQKITFSNLPFQTLANQTFVVLTSSGNTFTIGTLTGESIGLGNDSVTPGVSSVSVVGGSFTATITSLSSGVFTHNGIASATHRTIERFPLLWRNHIDDETVNSWRFLDSHTAFSSGAANRSITGLSRFEGKTITVVQEGQSPITRTVSGGSITVPAAAAGYLGLPYTSTLTPMKLDAEFDDGTSQGRKKRIHKVIARVYKSRGGQVRTNNGEWYALADTLTTGDQKLLLAGAFGNDADITIRTSAPYPLNLIAILPVWDAYGNE